NCELTKPGETVIHKGVTILGPANLPSEVAYHASQMYAKNITTFLLHLLEEGKIKFDMEDEIIAETLITRGGNVVNPRVCEALGIQPPAAEEIVEEQVAEDNAYDADDDSSEGQDMYGVKSDN
ncbi:MAG: hypothetical protein JXM70_21660, partial [Pirellulales bacterium]|nr:hypothetical protein [Pirellulales bacterium]